MNAPIDDIPGKRAAEQLGIFRRAAALLASSLEFEQTLANVISACLPALGDFGFFDVVTDDGVRRAARAHLDPETETILLPTQWSDRHAPISICVRCRPAAGKATHGRGKAGQCAAVAVAVGQGRGRLTTACGSITAVGIGTYDVAL